MADNLYRQKILILDFGSQYTQLITRKTRELGYSSEIYTVKQVKEKLTAVGAEVDVK